MVASSSSQRRVRHEIISHMLEIAKGGIRKTHIMSKTGLSYSQLVKYLAALKKAGLIEEESGIWKTTDSGKRVVEACRICQKLMREINQN